MVLAITAFVVAGVIAVPALTFVGVLLIAAVALGFASLHLGHRPDHVRRLFSPEISAVGEEVAVSARVECRTLLPTTAGTWRDQLPAGIEGDAVGVFPGLRSGLVPGGHSVDLGYRMTTRRRGIHPIGPLTVTTTDPFGFARRTQRLDTAVPLTVTPALVTLSALEELPGDVGGGLQTATDRLGQGADNLIPRSYQPGDSMRRIHWRASAHRGDLMVRQEEQESHPEAVVVFDRSLGRWSADALRAPGADTAFELAVSAAASAVARFVREGYTVAVLDADGGELAEPLDAGDTTALEAVIVSFATLTARRDGSLADTAPLFAGTTLGPVVVVTGPVGEADAALLAPITVHSSLPVLISVGAEPLGLRAASAVGWRTLSLEPTDELNDLWDQWAPERGATRAG